MPTSFAATRRQNHWPANPHIPSVPGMITDLHGEYFFLDNFYWSDVTSPIADLPVVKGTYTYPTVEHGYQAAKAATPSDWSSIARADSPGQAKAYGQTIPLRPDWEEIKNRVMWELLVAKFAPYTVLRAMLDATAPQLIVEGNTWHDRVWGQDPLGVGENRLGRMLVAIRDGVRPAWIDRAGSED